MTPKQWLFLFNLRRLGRSERMVGFMGFRTTGELKVTEYCQGASLRTCDTHFGVVVLSGAQPKSTYQPGST